MAKYNFKSFYDTYRIKNEVPFVCPVLLGGCGETHRIKIGAAGELEEVKDRCYFLENNPDFEEQIGTEWRENYRDNWLRDMKTNVWEDGEVEKKGEEGKEKLEGKCDNCSHTIYASREALKGRHSPKFWGLKRTEKVMCEKCLEDNQTKMKPLRRNLFRMYQRTFKFYPNSEPYD